MTQPHLVHQVTPETIVLFFDRTRAPRVLSAAAAIESAAKAVSSMMTVEQLAAIGSQHLYLVHDGVESGVIVHVDLVRNRVHIFELTGGTNLGSQIEQCLDGAGYYCELTAVDLDERSYLYLILIGRCPIFDPRALVFACISEADCDDLCA